MYNGYQLTRSTGYYLCECNEAQYSVDSVENDNGMLKISHLRENTQFKQRVCRLYAIRG